MPGRGSERIHGDCPWMASAGFCSLCKGCLRHSAKRRPTQREQWLVSSALPSRISLLSWKESFEFLGALRVLEVGLLRTDPKDSKSSKNLECPPGCGYAAPGGSVGIRVQSSFALPPFQR